MGYNYLAFTLFENPMAENDQKKSRNNGWQQGLSFFVQLSGWLAGPLVAALFLGKWLDKRYGTDPWLFLLSVGLAFVITSFGLFRETVRFAKQIEQAGQNKKKEETNGRERNNPKSDF